LVDELLHFGLFILSRLVLIRYQNLVPLHEKLKLDFQFLAHFLLRQFLPKLRLTYVH
jgi:hypothetical protein